MTLRSVTTAGALALLATTSGAVVAAQSESATPTAVTTRFVQANKFVHTGWGTTESTAWCPTGYVVTGGGLMYDVDYDALLQYSAPTRSSTREGWKIQVKWTVGDGAKTGVYAQAACLLDQ